ncbi:MAG: MaoC family dehydratase [Chloroflexi bacterium]|nr:MaoC family dehydratase [Chloroflexota bacterium]
MGDTATPPEARDPRRHDGRETFGRYLDDFVAGDEFVHWPGRTITEYDDTLFAALTMNQHPVHSDAAYAEGTQHGQRLVVGTLVFSLVVGMTVRDISGRAIANLQYDAVRHLAPAFHGDTIYARSTVLGVRRSERRPDRGVLEVETIAENQRGEPVLSFRRSVLLPCRPADGGAA